MSRDDYDDVEDVVTAKKNKMTVEKFFQQFSTLDSSNYGAWPLSVKVTVWFFILVAVVLVGYFVVIQRVVANIDKADAQQASLLNEFRDKDSKLRNLQQYEAQLKAIEANFSQQLEQLPKESEIPSLVEDINMTGVNAGLKFNGIQLSSEIKQEFFIEQPINIISTGDFHAFGAFASAIAALPRIVTLHDFKMSAKTEKADGVPVVTYEILAKTYRYSGDSKTAAKEDSSAEGDKP